MANALTAARLLLVVPFALLMARDDEVRAAIAGLVFSAAIATDLLDGVIARRHGTATSAGATFDHTVDFLFVASGLAAGAARGAFPWILPVLVTAAFAQYAADSYWIHRARALRTSRLGRYNGILYFAPLGGDILVRVGIGSLRPLLTVVTWALVVSTAVSMAERLWAVVAARASEPGAPARRRGDRRPPSG